jgi:hypothetical protein
MPWEHTRRMRKEANLDPEFIASFLDIKEGEKIIDIGGGDGFFSLAFKKFTPNVYLLDIENWSGQDFKAVGINYIESNFCNYSKDDTFHIGFMANVYHDFRLECKENTLKNLKRMIIRRIGILDFIPWKAFFGPPFKLEENVVINDLQEIGFKLTKKNYFPYHYYLVFDKE